MIYLIKGAGRYKIGYSEDPVERLMELQCGSPVRLMMVAVGQGDRRREADLQHQFRAHRYGGEWFQFNKRMLPDVIAAIEAGAGSPSSRAARSQRIARTAQRNLERARHAGVVPRDGRPRASRVKRSWVEPS